MDLDQEMAGVKPEPAVGDARTRDAWKPASRTVMVFAAFLVLTGAFGAAALFLPKPAAAKSYPLEDVRAAVASSCRSVGARLDESRTVSGNLRLTRYGKIVEWGRRLVSDEPLDDVLECSISSGTGPVKLGIHHSHGVVHQIKISPDSSKTALDIKAGMLKILPGCF